MATQQTLKLGCADAAEVPSDIGQCTAPYHDWPGNPGKFRAEPNNVWCLLAAKDNSQVAMLQRNLKIIDFNPKGADGIFGNRIPAINNLTDGFVLKFGTESLITHITSSYAQIIARKCPSYRGQSIH